MYLTDRDLRAKLAEFSFDAESAESPFNPEHQIGPCSVDLRLSKVYWTPRTARVAPYHRPRTSRYSSMASRISTEAGCSVRVNMARSERGVPGSSPGFPTSYGCRPRYLYGEPSFRHWCRGNIRPRERRVTGSIPVCLTVQFPLFINSERGCKLEAWCRWPIGLGAAP